MLCSITIRGSPDAYDRIHNYKMRLVLENKTLKITEHYEKDNSYSVSNSVEWHCCL